MQSISCEGPASVAKEQPAAPAISDSSGALGEVSTSRALQLRARARSVGEIEELLERVEQDPEFACERSYVQTKGALANNPPLVDGRRPSNLDFTKAAFLKDCHALPPAVQRCQVFEYAFKRNAYCKQERAKYDSRG